MSLLLDGNIPQQIINNLLTTSLESTAQFCLDLFERNSEAKFKSIADMLWNPITACLFKVAASKVTMRKETILSRLPRKAEQRLKPAKLPVSLPDGEIASIRHKLNDIKLTRSVLYDTPGHPHVKCVTPSCKICQCLFTNLNITKCEGHKRCSKVGWYPHVGPSLWQMIRKKHAENRDVGILPKSCKAHEIPALASVDICRSQTDSDSMQDDVLSNDGSTASYASTLKRNRSPLPDGPWIDDVEAYYLSRIQKKTKSSPEIEDDEIPTGF